MPPRRLAAILAADVTSAYAGIGLARPKTTPTAASLEAVTSVITQGADDCPCGLDAPREIRPDERGKAGWWVAVQPQEPREMPERAVRLLLQPVTDLIVKNIQAGLAADIGAGRAAAG